MILTAKVKSKSTGRVFELRRYTEYSIDLDLEQDADSFSLVSANNLELEPNLIGKFDDIELSINGTKVITGSIDRVRYIGESDTNLLNVNGRNVAGILVDNDAMPKVLNNIRPTNYMRGICDEYGIKHEIAEGLDSRPKLIIGTGESEISILNNLVLNAYKYVWAINDTIYAGDWSTNDPPSYRFVRGGSIADSITYKSIDVDDNGLSQASEYHIYGTYDNGDGKMVGSSENKPMKDLGVRKRKTIRSSNNDSISKYSASALKHIREEFRQGLTVTLELYFKDSFPAILPNRTADLIDVPLGINSTFFIKKVSYKKSLSQGSIAVIHMIPADSTFEVLWTKKSSVVGTALTTTKSLSELLKERK